MRGQSIFVVVVFLFLVLSATSVHLSFVINFLSFFSPAYSLVEVTAEMMVRRRHRLVGMQPQASVQTTHITA